MGRPRKYHTEEERKAARTKAAIKSRNKRNKKDPRYSLWVSSKNNAYNNGLVHDLEIEDIVIPEYCPVLGFKLAMNGRFPNSMSIDKIDPTKGYTKGNVRVISFKANRLKSNGRLEDFRAIVAYLEREANGEDHSS